MPNILLVANVFLLYYQTILRQKQNMSIHSLCTPNNCLICATMCKSFLSNRVHFPSHALCTPPCVHMHRSPRSPRATFEQRAISSRKQTILSIRVSTIWWWKIDKHAECFWWHCWNIYNKFSFIRINMLMFLSI